MTATVQECKVVDVSPTFDFPAVTETLISSVEITATATEVVTVDQQQSVDPILFYPSSASLDSVTSIFIDSTTSNLPPTSTVTVVAPPPTVTEIITVLPSSSISPTTSTLQPSPSGPPPTWSAPTLMTDLDSFNITKFADGQANLAIVNAVPSSAASSSSTSPADYVSSSLPTWENTSSVMQLYYPSGSINPGNANAPLGGADFYASPITDLSSAQNVTLEYSVFFPANFSWVEGGKLPGMYGGHTTCSGGDNATTCFSTRLMWRADGAGELYLYAPKNKQPASLCSTPPLSVCDAEYGLSIGRGSFYFTPGAWTDVRQTVALNTPGEQDGSFTLDVNGLRVIDVDDVYYRDAPTPTSASDGNGHPTASGTTTRPSASSTGLLSPIFGGLPILGVGDSNPAPTAGPLLGGLLQAQAPIEEANVEEAEDEVPMLLPLPTAFPHQIFSGTLASFLLSPSTGTIASTVTHTQISSAIPPPIPTTEVETLDSEQDPTQDALISFTGLFFSTFFGGDTSQYATPRDQYTWFKGFAFTINS